MIASNASTPAAPTRGRVTGSTSPGSNNPSLASSGDKFEPSSPSPGCVRSSAWQDVATLGQQQMSAFIRCVRHTGFMRQAFVHEAILVMEPEADEAAPGAAVTVALCGHWDHEGPCPLSPHRAHADRVGDELHVTVVFAAEPETEHEVRRRIDRALSGRWRFPDGFTTPWQLRESRPRDVLPEERSQAERLMRG